MGGEGCTRDRSVEVKGRAQKLMLRMEGRAGKWMLRVVLYSSVPILLCQLLSLLNY